MSPALSDVDRSLIFVGGIVFVHVQPLEFMLFGIQVFMGLVDPIKLKKKLIARIEPITRVIGLIREEEIHE